MHTPGVLQSLLCVDAAPEGREDGGSDGGEVVSCGGQHRAEGGGASGESGEEGLGRVAEREGAEVMVQESTRYAIHLSGRVGQY